MQIDTIRTAIVIMSSQEELIRQAREMQLQRQREARSTVQPRFGPAVDGVFWNRVGPEGEADSNSQRPILSILEFPLKPGIDMRNKSKTPRKLWDAALHYVNSIPGCESIEWGIRLKESPTTLFCLVHWSNTVAWQMFQYSMGFTSIIGLLRSSPSNRCAKLGTSDAPRLSSAQDSATVIDIISIAFDGDNTSSPEHRSAFEESWNAVAQSVSDKYDVLGHCSTVWLENNASTFFNPTTAEAATANKSTFTAFLVWNETHYDSGCARDVCDSLQASLTSSPGTPPSPTISRNTVQLMTEAQQHDSEPPLESVAPPNNPTSILKLDLRRQCSANLVNLREHARLALARSISDARARTRLFPAPQGSFISQGELYEGNMPILPEWRSTWGHSRDYHIVDVVWVQLHPGVSASQSFSIYKELNDQTSRFQGFVKSFWARDAEDEAKFAMLTVWGNEDARGSVSGDYRRNLDDFARSSIHLAAPLTFHNFPMARAPVDLWLHGVRYLELTCFRVQPGLLERQLFEHAYAAFVRMTEPSPVAGIPTACRVMNAGGWQSSRAIEHLEFQLFTGALMWANPAARLEWYEELSRVSCGSYELFGHKLDILKILSIGEVRARLLVL